MPTFVVSDLHLDTRERASLFHDERQGRHLAGLFEELARTPDAELILLGDTFDFTSLLPPEQGLERFADELGFPLEVAPARTVRGMLSSIEESNPKAMAALREVCERLPVTLVVGNHDWQLALPEAPDALQSMGLGRARLHAEVERTIAGKKVRLEHGHRFDASNAAPGGSGEVLTRALYQAVIPFLQFHGVRPNMRLDPDRLAAIRPAERALLLLERWLEPKTYHALVRAFLRLAAANRHLPALARELVAHAPPSLVRRKLDGSEGVWQRAAEQVRKGELAKAEVVVLGHTHVLDWVVDRARLYVNLGTWTDRASDGLSPPDTTLPVLRLEERAGRLHAELRDMDDDGGVLETFREERALARSARQERSSARGWTRST